MKYRPVGPLASVGIEVFPDIHIVFPQVFVFASGIFHIINDAANVNAALLRTDHRIAEAVFGENHHTEFQQALRLVNHRFDMCRCAVRRRKIKFHGYSACQEAMGCVVGLFGTEPGILFVVHRPVASPHLFKFQSEGFGQALIDPLKKALKR